MDKEELLPCPFCGSNDIDSRFTLQADGNEGTGCMKCGASTEPKPTIKESVKAWNTRISND